MFRIERTVRPSKAGKQNHLTAQDHFVSTTSVRSHVRQSRPQDLTQLWRLQLKPLQAHLPERPPYDYNAPIFCTSKADLSQSLVLQSIESEVPVHDRSIRHKFNVVIAENKKKGGSKDRTTLTINLVSKY